MTDRQTDRLTNAGQKRRASETRPPPLTGHACDSQRAKWLPQHSALTAAHRCVIEIYTFVQMGGKKEKMIVEPIHDDDDDLESKLSTFDASKAQCFLSHDRHRLCARNTGCKHEPWTLLRGLTRIAFPRAGLRWSRHRSARLSRSTSMSARS